MATTKHSKKRDALIDELCSRYDHPTAEDLYVALKKEIPNLSLGTVYRNLAALCAGNQVMKISVDGADRYDGNAKEHVHFLCRECGKMTDVFQKNENLPFNSELLNNISGKIESYSLILYGTCGECKE